MTLILVATSSGIRTFTDAGELSVELPGHQVCALARAGEDSSLAVVGGREIWRRGADTGWSLVATSDVLLMSIVYAKGQIFGGAMAEAVMVRVGAGGQVERLEGFDRVPGRREWFAQGPPIHVRSLTTTADGGALLAAVHVGGLPRSTDGGDTWEPTIPVSHDAHEVRAHATLPLVAAATGAGLCVSLDAGKNWSLFSEGPEVPDSLAVAVLEEEVLFSVQDGPFATRSQLWRWPVGGAQIEQVREGLPLWLDGKVDTAHMAAGNGRAAVVDGGGNLWLSKEGSRSWTRIASGLSYAFGVLVI